MLVFATACSEEAGTKTASPAQYILAFSWQPAFCESAPRKPECRSQNPDRYDVTHFALHGLWPQPGSNIYCNVPKDEIERDKRGRWRDLDTKRIHSDIWKNLKKVMPGTRSSLHKHEWIKHGTCTPADVDEYYAKSLWLMAQLNKSGLRHLFADNIGKTLNSNQIRSAFNKAFGKGMGNRLRVSCFVDKNSGRQLIREITLGLGDPFGSPTADKKSFAELIQSAPKTEPGCPHGLVDPVGLQ